MTVRIAIVADDLTGAGDSAVQFVRAGWRTHLAMGDAAAALAHAKTADVEAIAVTTHTRAMGADEASAVIAQEMTRLKAAGVRRLYKKVDSTLRGPFRAEIESARAAWGHDAIAVVCPAFPATGRTVKDGMLMVGDVPVTQTSAASDPVTPVTEAHIPTLLGGVGIAAAPGETAQALADRIAQAGPVVVIDAVTAEDLDLLAQAIVCLGDRALPVGAGGLAIPLARLWAGEASRGVIVVLVTSQHSAARAQAAALRADGARVFMPTLAQLADTDAWLEFKESTLAALDDLAAADTALVLAPDGRLDGLHSDRVAEKLGALTAAVVRRAHAAGVVATGGDGARQVVNELGANGVALIDEVTGGMPIGTLTGGASAGLPVVTKAGGFGGDDVLVRAVRAIRERRFSV